jgi:long-chain acyl-CoA synthetase
LVRRLPTYGDALAVVAFSAAGGAERWSFAQLGETVARLSAGLAGRGLRRGDVVALQAPNSPYWMAAYLAVVSAGGIAMPLDDKTGPAEIEALLAANACRWLITTQAHARARRAHEDLAIFLIDAPEDEPGSSLQALRSSSSGPLPEISADDIAVIVHTSGTTGTPKAVPLSHANLMSNIGALLDERLVAAGDRALLPLPLHHVYPMTVGFLTPMAAGAGIVFPAGISGPELAAALRHGVTHLVGVPRLYTALLDGIWARVQGQGRLAARIVRRLLTLSMALAMRRQVHVGRLLFYPLHRQLAPRLRLLVSGGAALDRDVEAGLEGFGWVVLTGYGLSETSPILAFNRRGEKRLGSAGRPLPGVELRIASPGSDGVGEIEARGASVFPGYRNNPEATRTAFTADGWFRTGDLGRIDRDGYLHIAARVNETIVLAGGKKVFPETAEAVFTDSPVIQEMAVLGYKGQLVALVVPNLEELRRRGGGRPEDTIREELAERAARLPAYERLAGFAITHEKLPRTQLGKPRRHLLPPLYERALEGRESAAPAELSEDDRKLIAAPVADRLWTWLQTRFPDRPLSLDTSPQLDLGIDSLAWVNLTLDIQRAVGLTLTEAAIARVITLRDLLREAVAAAEQPAQAAAAPEVPFDIVEPAHANLLVRAMRRILASANTLVMTWGFRLRVVGAANVPEAGPCVICPNHASFLDPFAVAAALPYRTLQQTWWAGWTGLLFANRAQRAFSALAQVLPVDPDRAAASSLTLGGAVIDHHRYLVWFPEGARSRDGTLQRFLPGIGVLLASRDVPVVPVHIAGTYAAWPRGRRFPRRADVTVRFGAPVTIGVLAAEAGSHDPEQIAEALRGKVEALAGR